MILDEILKDKKLVFDIGANIGAKTELFLKYGVRVICAEPQEECLKELKVKFENANVIIIPYALSSDGKIRKFRVSTANTLSTFSKSFVEKTGTERFKTYKWSDSVDIKTITIDSLVQEWGVPDYCKIDVEGSEPEVLKGLSYPISYISFEYVPELHYKAVECINIISGIGSYLFNYSEGESLNFENKIWIEGKELLCNLWVKKDKITFGDIYCKVV